MGSYSPGNVITLLASAARTDATSPAYGATFDLLNGFWMPKDILVLLSTTAHATDAGDTLDVYVDMSQDETTWVNAGHYTQIAGNATAPIKRWLWLSRSAAAGTADLLTSSDAASGVVRPNVIARYMRVRWVIAEAGGNDASHTFSVTAQVF